MIVVETPRLILRLFEMSEAETLHRVIFGAAAVMRYGMGMKTLDETRPWIIKHRRNYEQFRLGKWALVLRDTNELIGYCGFTAQKMIDDVAETELGYRLAQPHWGKGFATEAATAARDYAFHTLKLPRIIAIIDPANTPSIRVAEKLGMAYERDVMLDGYTHPDRMYAIAAPAVFEPFESKSADRSPPLDVRVRDAKIQDVGAIAALQRQRSGGDILQHIERIEHSMNEKLEFRCVAELDGRIIGFGTYGRIEQPPNPPANSIPSGWYLKGVIVDPVFRRRGVGAAITQFRMNTLFQTTDIIYYFANEANRASIELHRSFGFVEIACNIVAPDVTFSGTGVGVLFRAMRDGHD